MPTYLYETIPATASETPLHLELEQAATDAPFTNHPETNQAIRRVILGGYGASDENADKDCGCGPGCC